ncbi:MAG: excinuclease ABC subunit UvrA, partial [Gemmatimonadota bacterium]
EGSRVQILAPVVRGRRGEYRKELEEFRRKGFVRVRIDGELHDLGNEIRIPKRARHDIEVVVDRLLVKASARGRLTESLETALSLAGGLVKIDVVGEQEWLFSESAACTECGISLPELAPRMFSFNNPYGACPACNGLGVGFELDAERVVPDPDRSLAEGAIEPWGARGPTRYYAQLLASLGQHLEIDLELPWKKLPRAAREALLHGTGEQELEFVFRRGRRRERVRRRWDGVLGELARRAAEEVTAARGVERYRSPVLCGECEGSRLRSEARHVRLGGHALHELCALPIASLPALFDALELGVQQRAVAERVLHEIADRVRFLCDVGLGYLSLDRPSATLSGGEGQRIRLATQIGSSLMGVLYILDEPSIGLHPRDNGLLLESLLRLRDMGNSVLVVEHDEATIRCADHVIDMGPGAGIHGGEVVAEGTPAEVMSNASSPTGAYLSGRRCIAVPDERRKPGRQWLVLQGCQEHNLKRVKLELPLGVFTVVTGVSGSGKSTLINDTLHRALAQLLHGAEQRPGRFSRIKGVELLDKVIDVSQAPIGRTPRSNPATYSGALGGIRQLFSQVP